jgi:hypothetical protein
MSKPPCPVRKGATSLQLILTRPLFPPIGSSPARRKRGAGWWRKAVTALRQLWFGNALPDASIGTTARTRPLSSSRVKSSLPPRKAKKGVLAMAIPDFSRPVVPAHGVSPIASERLPSSERTCRRCWVLVCEAGTCSSGSRVCGVNHP